MTITFTDIGVYDVQGLMELPPILDFPTLKVEFEGNFALSNWIRAGRLYRIGQLEGENPIILGSQEIWLQQPTLIQWPGTNIPYKLKFEPTKWIGFTPLRIKLAGSYEAPPTGGTGGGETDPETIQDTIAAMLTSSNSIQVTYNDSLNQLVLTAIFGTTAGTVCSGADVRLSDRRLPQLGSVTNAEVADDAAISWTKISKSGASPAEVGAAPLAHQHQAIHITDLIEAVQDIVATFLIPAGTLSKDYNDETGTLTLTATGGSEGAMEWEDLILDSTAWEAAIA